MDEIEMIGARMSRRALLASGAASGLAAGLGLPGAARAQGKEIVLCNWGGVSATNAAKIYGEPFRAETGVALRIDGSGPTLGRIKAMVEARQVVWDVCDSDLFTAMSLGKAGLLEPIDYSIVDKSKVGEGWAIEHGVGSFIIGWVMVYNKTLLPNGAPETPADFFDTRKFPGKRAVYAGVQSTAEWALRADGVPADKLYPLDLDRAAKKVKTLGADLTTYTASPDVLRRLRTGELAMAILGHTWASIAQDDTRGDVTFSFKHALLSPQSFMIPKGNPGGAKLASEFIASTLTPQRQLNLFLAQASGPTNPAATQMLPADKKHLNPSDPANVAVMLRRNDAWYAEHYIEANAKFRELLA